MRCLLLLTLILCKAFSEGFSVKQDEKLFMFLIDGFKWDYLDRYQLGDLPGFDRILQYGVKAEYVTPDFVSDSYPNYYTLMTGLYTENHGMVHNYMWDPDYPDQEFIIGINEDQYNPHWWNDAEPFWITAERQGLSVFMWYWCGCEVEIQGLRPSYCLSYQDNGSPSVDDLNTAINAAVDVFQNGTADIAGIYFEQLDARGHNFGTDGVDLAIRNLDDALNRMFQRTDEEGLSDRINLVMFGDHGMADLTPGNSIDLRDYMNDTDYERIFLGSTTTQIWPFQGEEEWLYEKLKDKHPNLHVYKPDEMPEHWHNGNHRRIPPVFLSVDIGWKMHQGISSNYPGRHGYDNLEEDMRTVFMAHGPAYEQNYQITGIHAVDIYQTLCYVTTVVPENHNGTWSKVCDMFVEPNACFE